LASCVISVRICSCGQPFYYLPDCAKQGAVTLFLQRLHRLIWQRSARLLEGIESGIEIDKGELQTKRRWQCFEKSSSGWDDLAANAIASDEALRYVKNLSSSSFKVNIPKRIVRAAAIDF
jgi:hypothetical protein